jgi:hypothetical protein
MGDFVQCAAKQSTNQEAPNYNYSMHKKLLSWSSQLLIGLIVILFLDVQGKFVDFISQNYNVLPQRLYYGIVGSLGTIGIAVSLLRNTVQRWHRQVGREQAW